MYELLFRVAAPELLEKEKDKKMDDFETNRIAHNFRVLCGYEYSIEHKKKFLKMLENRDKIIEKIENYDRIAIREKLMEEIKEFQQRYTVYITLPSTELIYEKESECRNIFYHAPNIYDFTREIVRYPQWGDREVMGEITGHPKTPEEIEKYRNNYIQQINRIDFFNDPKNRDITIKEIDNAINRNIEKILECLRDN